MPTLRLYPNPVLRRELRVRWRGGRMFLVLFAFSALLALCMLWLYANATQSYYEEGDALTSMKRSGHDIFLGLTIFQTIAWLIIAPLLTATAITGERERGLLEGLQLSRLKSYEIVCGKFVSALSLVFLIILTTMPVTSISLLLGGVSPAEFLFSSLLNFITAATGVAFGLACSAWCRRGNAAIPITIFSVIGWLVATGACLIATFVPGRGLPHTIFFDFFSFELFDPGRPNTLAIVLNTLSYSNPLIAIPSLIYPDISQSLQSGVFFGGFDSTATNLLLQSGLIVVLLWLAARGVRRIFPEKAPVHRKKVLGLHRHGKNWRLGLQPALESSAISNADLGSSGYGSNGTTRSRWHSAPLLSYIRFKNPVLHREFHSKFRLRFSVWAVLLIVLGFIPLAILYAACALMLFGGLWVSGADTEPVWLGCFMGGLFVGSITTAAMTAKAFTREHETGNWEALQLSILSRREILLGKLLSTLLFFGLLALPWLLLLTSAVHQVLPTQSSMSPSASDYGPTMQASTISFVHAACLLWVLCSTLCFSSAIGLWISWHLRRTAPSIAWTFGALIMIWVLLPIAESVLSDWLRWGSLPKTVFDSFPPSLFGASPNEWKELVWNISQEFLNFTHPFMAVGRLMPSAIDSFPELKHALIAGSVCGIFQFALSTVILLHLHRAMLRRERDHRAGFLSYFSLRKTPALQH